MKKICLALVLFSWNVMAAPRVAIIGGGVGGAKLASQLKGVKADLHIFEAQDRIGGRSYSRTVTLSNGMKTTINVGTQMNFAELLKVAPELKQLKDLFHTPEQCMTVLASSPGSSATRVFGVERATNPGDTERARQLGEKMVRDGFLNTLDLSLSSLAAYFLKTNHLDTLPFDDLSHMYSVNPRWDAINAEEFLRDLSFNLRPHTSWGDWWTANKLWLQYMAAPIGPEKARLAAAILENSLYYGLITPKQRTAYFTRNYIRNVVQSMESLVEFTDLKSMSALNFLWQLKWAADGGNMITARSWASIPEFYLSQNPSANVHLKNRVQSVTKEADGRFKLTVQTPEGLKTEIFDVVINSADTDNALTMTQFEAPELKDFLKFNTYTSTIAVHVEIDKTAAQIFGDRSGVALVASPGILKSLGGVTFHTKLFGESLKGREIVGLFAQSEAAAEVLKLAKERNWSESQIGEHIKQLFIRDLEYLPDVRMLRESIERGSALSTAGWEKALPHFGVGHMAKVDKYRRVMGKDGYFYLGQALYGRSVVMVLAGLDRDVDMIKRAIQEAGRR